MQLKTFARLMNRRSLIVLVTALMLLMMVLPAAAQDTTAAALTPEEALAEALLDFCFGKENMDIFYRSDMGEQPLLNLFTNANVDDETRDAFLIDVATLADDDIVGFNDLLVDYCLGDGVYEQIAPSINDYTVWYPIFIDLGYTEADVQWFFYYIELEYDELYLELWLIDLGLDDAQIAEIMASLNDPDA